MAAHSHQADQAAPAHLQLSAAALHQLLLAFYCIFSPPSFLPSLLSPFPLLLLFLIILCPLHLPPPLSSLLISQMRNSTQCSGSLSQYHDKVYVFVCVRALTHADISLHELAGICLSVSLRAAVCDSFRRSRRWTVADTAASKQQCNFSFNYNENRLTFKKYLLKLLQCMRKLNLPLCVGGRIDVCICLDFFFFCCSTDCVLKYILTWKDAIISVSLCISSLTLATALAAEIK